MKRCVWVGCAVLAATFAAAAPAAENEAGFISMFDGKTLDGWDGDPKFWSVEDGAITGRTTAENPTPANTFLIWRGGQPEDFELRLQFRIVGGNSGVQYRSREVAKWVLSGYQADFDAAGAWVGSLYEEKGRGVLARRGTRVVIHADGKKEVVGETTPEQKLLESVQQEGWNDLTIIARGNRLTQLLNGMLSVEVVDNQKEKRAAAGLIGLQVHRGPPMTVQFRNLRIKRLPPR